MEIIKGGNVKNRYKVKMWKRIVAGFCAVVFLVPLAITRDLLSELLDRLGHQLEKLLVVK